MWPRLSSHTAASLKCLITIVLTLARQHFLSFPWSFWSLIPFQSLLYIPKLRQNYLCAWILDLHLCFKNLGYFGGNHYIPHRFIVNEIWGADWALTTTTHISPHPITFYSCTKLCFYCAHLLNWPWICLLINWEPLWTYTLNVLVSKTSDPIFTYSHVATDLFSLSWTQHWNESFCLRHTDLNVLYSTFVWSANYSHFFNSDRRQEKHLIHLYKCAQMPMGDHFLHYSDITIIYRWEGIWENTKIRLQINKYISQSSHTSQNPKMLQKGTLWYA